MQIFLVRRPFEKGEKKKQFTQTLIKL